MGREMFCDEKDLRGDCFSFLSLAEPYWRQGEQHPLLFPSPLFFDFRGQNWLQRKSEQPTETGSKPQWSRICRLA